MLHRTHLKIVSNCQQLSHCIRSAIQLFSWPCMTPIRSGLLEIPICRRHSAVHRCPRCNYSVRPVFGRSLLNVRPTVVCNQRTSAESRQIRSHLWYERSAESDCCHWCRRRRRLIFTGRNWAEVTRRRARQPTLFRCSRHGSLQSLQLPHIYVSFIHQAKQW